MEPAVGDRGGGPGAVRQPGLGGESWAAQHALPLAVAWPLLLTAIFLPLSVRRYRGLGH